MGKIVLYHGTQNKIVTPAFGGGMINMIMVVDFI